MLILIFGYGLSFDVKNAPVAIVTEDTSPTAQDVVAGFYLSPYFTVTPLTSMREAQRLMRERKVDAIVYLQSDFSRRLAAGDATIQVLVNGVDANRARVLQAFAQGAIGQWSIKRAAAGEGGRAAGTAGVAADSPVVQRGEQQHLLSCARLDRDDHDAERRAADITRHGARVGTRHARSAVRHARQ